jgi:hypothetical protein
MANARNASIDIAPFVAFTDASGAPTTVTIAGYVFACDFLGDVRLNCIRPASGSRTESKIAAQRARDAYRAALSAKVNYDWLARNAAVYGPGSPN